MNTCYTEDDPDDDDNVHKLSSLSCHKKIQQKIKTDLCMYNFFHVVSARQFSRRHNMKKYKSVT